MGASRLGFYDVPNVECRHCGETSLHRVTAFGKYFSLSIVPMFPTGVTMTAECEHCNKTIPQHEFPPALNQQYKPNKARLKRPWWHYAGVSAIAIFWIFGLVSNAIDSLDPRSEMLKNDIAQMRRTPPESDTLATKLSTMYMVATIGDQLDEADFNYLVKVKGDNALMLVSIPTLDDYDEESREQMMEVMEMVADQQFDLLTKNMYYGLRSSNKNLVVKTPTNYIVDDNIANSYLYDFYGAKE